MNRPTFQNFRQRVAAYANSIGSPLGTCIGDIPALSGLVNAATERLLFDPTTPDEGWWGGWGLFVFNISQGQPMIVLPRGLARIILMDVCKRPTKVQNGFYEFLDFGPGLQPRGNGTCNGFPGSCGQQLQAYEREYVSTLSPLLPGGQHIQVFPTDARDVGRTVIVQGSDQNGNVIYSTDPVTNQTILGESVILAQPFIKTQNQFSVISGIEKDSTFGPVTFFQFNSVTSTSQSLSMMEPSETSAAYRSYLVNGLPCNCCNTGGPVQVTAMCKIEFTPVASDSDYLVIPNVPALFAECEALRMESMDNVKAQAIADKKHQKALQLLFGELTHYMGNERPAISVPIFGSDRLRPSFQ